MTDTESIRHDFTGSRLRVRRVDTDKLVASAIAQAAFEGKPRVDVEHGGEVANSYGYRAETEAALVVAFPDGSHVLWTARVPANKVTWAGAASACCPVARDLYDGRCPKGSVRESNSRKFTIAAAAAVAELQDLPSLAHVLDAINAIEAFARAAA